VGADGFEPPTARV